MRRAQDNPRRETAPSNAPAACSSHTAGSTGTPACPPTGASAGHPRARARPRTPSGGAPDSSRDTGVAEGDHDRVSRVLVFATLLFLALASSVLVWEGLATGIVHGGAPPRAERRRVRLRFTVGALVFAAVLWTALGLLTRAW